MASARGPNIDDIDDMMEVGELMKNLGLSAKGLKTIDEMKAKVKEHLRKNPVKDTTKKVKNTILFAVYRLHK